MLEYTEVQLNRRNLFSNFSDNRIFEGVSEFGEKSHEERVKISNGFHCEFLSSVFDFSNKKPYDQR